MASSSLTASATTPNLPSLYYHSPTQQQQFHNTYAPTTTYSQPPQQQQQYSTSRIIIQPGPTPMPTPLIPPVSSLQVPPPLYTLPQPTTSHHQQQHQQQNSESSEFRDDLDYDYNVIVGHFARNGVCFVDEEYTSVKRIITNAHMQIPSAALAVMQEEPSKMIQNFCKTSKSTVIVANNDQTEDSIPIETWSNLFKVPQSLSKLHGRQDHAWKSSLFSTLYKLVVRDFDNNFEEDREVPLDSSLRSLLGKEKLTDVLYIGIQKSKELRQLLKKLKSITGSLRQYQVGEVFLPFFASQEQHDRSSQYQAENELACAMRVLMDSLIAFFGQEPKKVFGMTCVGCYLTAYVMRKHMEDQVYVLQPLETYNLMVHEDIIRAAKYLLTVRLYGLQLIQECASRLAQYVNLQQANNELDGAPATTEETEQQQQQQQQEVNNARPQQSVPAARPQGNMPRPQQPPVNNGMKRPPHGAVPASPQMQQQQPNGSPEHHHHHQQQQHQQ